MAKARVKKPTQEEPKSETQTPKILDPAKVHALFGLTGPYEPPPAPISTKGFVTFWDSGCSILTLAKKQPKLVRLHETTERFAKDSDSWKWREINLTPVGLGETFEEQQQNLPKGYEPPAARELVTFLLLHFLVTGQRLDIPRLRCKDVMASGRRVIVGPFHEMGLEIANVSDRWKSPGIATCCLFTPVVRKK